MSLSQSPAEHAWHFIEKSKAMVLLNTLKDADAKVNAQIPAELLEKEYDLRVELLYLERTIVEQEVKRGNERDQAFIDKCRIEQFDYNEKWQQLIAQFEGDYPDYFNLKHQTKLPSINQIRQYLLPQTLVINYLIVKQHFYICTLSTTNIQFFRFDKPTNFDQLCEDVLGYNHKSRNKYFAAAHLLYQLLLAPILSQEYSFTDLLIMPDDKLREIPFETLLIQAPTHKNTFDNQPYLLHTYHISYHYSAALWHHCEQRAAKKPSRPNSFVGFAPVYPDKTPVYVPAPNDLSDINLEIDWNEMPEDLRPQQSDFSTTTTKKYRAKKGEVRSVNLNGERFCELLKSEEEINNITQLFANRQFMAHRYVHGNATKQNFLEKSKGFKYVLIAAHNDFNPQKPDFSGILLSPGANSNEASVFTINETYHLQLQDAALVVLSCCDSGRGNDQKGEGTMAMNRGLLFSGADHVIYTLFKIPDANSALLTTFLFDELLKNPTISYAAALSFAKRRFVALYPNESPTNWAGFVLL
jgi:CHAT domain-containing protein